MTEHELRSYASGERRHRQNRSVRALALVPMLIFFACQWASPPLYAAPKRALVRWVNDGDTIVLVGGERVRYLGINAPEVAHEDQAAEPYGDRARSFNRSLVHRRWVRLKYTEQRRDHYGRLLACVFLEDGTFVNGELVRVGYAHLFRGQAEVCHWTRLLELQRKALREKRGIWSIAAVRPERVYFGNRRSWIFHRPDCAFARKMGRTNLIRIKDRNRALYQGFSPCRRCRP